MPRRSEPDGRADFESATSVPDTVGDMLRITRRHLPHWQVGGATYFMTIRLRGAWRRAAQRSALQAGMKPSPPAGLRRAPAAGWKPALPLNAEERGIVKQAILFWHGKKWTVHALTVMPDHVHILATPLEKAPGAWLSISRILQGIKQHTALEINRRRGMSGSLWQRESFDRIVRDEREFGEQWTYIISNASKAGLVMDGSGMGSGARGWSCPSARRTQEVDGRVVG